MRALPEGRRRRTSACVRTSGLRSTCEGEERGEGWIRAEDGQGVPSKDRMRHVRCADRDAASPRLSALLRRASRWCAKDAVGFLPMFATRAQEPDPVTGAVIPPISLSTTFKQNAPGEPKAGFDYSRSGNPTRDAFEKAVAALEKGKHGTYERECLNSSRGS